MSRVAIVTGGAGGIGKAIVKRLCEDGFAVAICYNSSEANAKNLASELSLKGFETKAFRLNVASATEAATVVKEITNSMGTPYILINNAGIAHQALFTDITYEEWSNMINTNLTGVYSLTQAVLPHMIHNKCGRIINISSMWGQVGASCEVHYCAAKAGVIGLTKALAKEVAPSGITVNCVAPGAIETKMMAGFSKDDIDSLCEGIPLCRLGKPEEVAAAVSFFVSDDASYITGQVLGVNGGMVV